ncbi:hypothetical protein ES703_80881 [subsurface metagenome]
MPDSGLRIAGGAMTPAEIRDALLSLPDNDRKFIVTNPRPGENKIFSIAEDGATDEVVSSCQPEP